MHTRIHPVHSSSAPLLSQVHIPALVYTFGSWQLLTTT